MVSCGFPSTSEPLELVRGDGKRPDVMTLVSWIKGLPLVWYSTVVETFAKSYIGNTSLRAEAAANIAEKLKKKQI